MKKHALILAATSLIAFAGMARADDHLVTALQHGLSPDSQALQPNKAGHSGDLAPGQGSPFVGADTQTPATDTEAANEHANVKERQPK
ncbi:MAG: hypothetical protein EOS54_06245 [Mesorhizobium sp.]|uniref:hypothetical protein n=1 Tax=unclassified Mesorhizobium TaxID=325217 RepID=UPI000F753FAC|nr:MULTISPECIES: hypothetical protein [unclassified Mesorhizobium]RVD68810.1 hypothetical protein EN751_29400 [Mesorhizobium sp. M4A.F.Ca.ET.029.04.2.1]AZO48131.1 hypothetical protein EJ073_10100 [Mesorhizobium sp. M4B.F.Ca.ET.058.02.1.1]RUX51255.1 hypothetical protein EOA33_06950 [Mesorhizobium sp. M4A.F.Ca.ET.050.02.1.1]RVC45373.1 hypothetical protein EN781_10215 [Mesorhizobium sp. M4A.F.Ca.ET.090.04.2.1]RVD44511.1 hypothetical protein EN742_02060 [Mesorhizobium sp. M4A.F.Ca.ET.020.02.1.1]